MKKLNITEIPSDWYERNRIIACSPCDDIVVYSSTYRSGDLFGLTRYFMSVSGKGDIPISQTLYDAFMSEYEMFSYYEYVYLDQYCNTYRLYEHGSDIYADN